MASSLDKLTANLDEASFQCVKKFFHDEQFDLVRRKGVFPYDYVNSITKLSETKLPPQEEFYSELNHSSISDEDYEHAKKVWKYFHMKKMKDYHDLYLKTDVLLLADVFENFRNVCEELQTWSSLVLHSSWISLACLPQENRSRVRITFRCWHAFNDWEWNSWWSFNNNKKICWS